MDEVTILSYLSEALNRTHLALPWKLEWQSGQAFIQLTLQYQDVEILSLDREYKKKDEFSSPVVYELYISLYDQSRMNKGFETSFLNIPCSTEGMSIGYLNALIFFIRRLAIRLEASWLEMKQEGVFNLTGSKDEIEEIVEGMKRKGTYNEQKLFFPSERG